MFKDNFRHKQGIKVSKKRQGYIFYTSMNYKELAASRQQRIRQLCQDAGGEHWEALFDFVTTEDGAVAICNRYFISESTLRRAVKKYYESWPRNL